MQTYRQLRGHDADFLVKYRLFGPSEGGRTAATFQHIRYDFMYDGEEPGRDSLSMIHPEFLDAMGQPLADDVPVPSEGVASMWVVFPESRPRHRGRIAPGVKGYMMEGRRKRAEVEVIEVRSLHENPDE